METLVEVLYDKVCWMCKAMPAQPENSASNLCVTCHKKEHDNQQANPYKDWKVVYESET